MGCQFCAYCLSCAGFGGALVSEAGDAWDWGLWRFLGAQRGSEIGKWETGRITVKKQEISQNDRKKWKLLERFKEKLRKLRSKGGENL